MRGNSSMTPQRYCKTGQIFTFQALHIGFGCLSRKIIACLNFLSCAQLPGSNWGIHFFLEPLYNELEVRRSVSHQKTKCILMIKTSFLSNHLARLVVVFGLLIGMSFVPAMTQAQEAESPLRLAFVNVSGSAGSSAYSSIEAILLQSNQLVLMDESTFLKGAAEHQLDLDTFRQSSAREENTE